MISQFSNDERAPPLWKGLLPLIIVASLATQDSIVSFFGSVCKPIALGILSGLGVSTYDMGLTIQADHLVIPWTRDCAGINMLLVLLAVYAWMNRGMRQGKNYWSRMALMLPAAIAANVLRILSLVAYRYIVYPAVESPQLHYFFGFLWLVPFSLLAIPKNTDRAKKALWFELLHISAVFGLLAPLLSLSNHWLTAVGTLLCLLNCQFLAAFDKKHLTHLTSWVLLAVCIAWVGIESLWLPWLLTCPLLINYRWLMSLSGIGCVATACPLFVLLPGAEYAAAGIFAYAIYNCYRDEVNTTIPCQQRLSLTWERVLSASMTPMLIAPFLASVIVSPVSQALAPPATAQQRALNGLGYELKIKGQPPSLGLLWYNPQGSDRHHALEVCLQYRGVHLTTTDVPSVKTDGEYWFKEFFLVKNKLIAAHRDYLMHTLGFRKDPGVHLILVAKSEGCTAESFASMAYVTADQLWKSLQQQEPGSVP
jgi:exosortase/archaeosortase family protein